MDRRQLLHATRRGPRRWLRPIAGGLGCVGVVVLLLLGPTLLELFTASYAARQLRFLFFETLFVAHAVAMIAAPLGLLTSIVVGLRARRRRNRRLASYAGKTFLLSLGFLIGIALCEAVCAWQLHGLGQLVHVPVSLAKEEANGLADETDVGPEPRPPRLPPGSEHPGRMIGVTILGESSALGVPFDPWISLDRIIAWQLGLAMPDKIFEAENRAARSLTLKGAIEKLVGIGRRPGLLIIYSGQNEFPARFGWDRRAPLYRIDPMFSRPILAGRIRAISKASEFLGQNVDRFGAELKPKAIEHKDPTGTPCCTSAEYAATLADYRRRLDSLLGECEAAGILTMVVVPPSNDGGFDPNRSACSPETSLGGQRSFIDDLKGVRRGESADPLRAMASYRRLIAAQPGFAETHYRLAQLLEAAGSYEEARGEYIRARDLDGFPFRCQTPFLEACRELGRRHKSIVIDGPGLLAAASPHGIVNDRLFSDAQHPGLNAYVILARDAIRQLRERRAFGWPDAAPAPGFTMADCITHFKLDNAAWIRSCINSREFYGIMAHLARERSWRESVSLQYSRAVELLKRACEPDQTGIPSLRIREELRADSSANGGGLE